ncbi:hypothetical protein GCM10023328_43810 [Modestobacter marinus]|uniref:Uncharacterized protein n=1 Tax=Modestobacter marinus TaxID=477641 RepID=A0A846LY27_9ACTN|nr:hypothetical protein [Modestobacter marinus]NIH68319.1 hypothetical protein [Modestobacter marinus]GGL56335.1 hypothetical protein GCM10011589_10380 [Modestobacter marinus]
MSREERWERRLALPVLVAALASVPAMFLTFAGGPLGTAGRWVDIASGVVLVGEAVVLLVVAQDKRAWIKGHAGLLLLSVAVLVAIVLAVGPVQLLRLVRAVGALRVLRAGRIVRAARELADRLGWTGRASAVFAAGAGVLAAVFVGVVLADPTSRSRSLLTWALGSVSPPVVVVLSVIAGALLGGATYLLARDSGLGDAPDEDEAQADDEDEDEDAEQDRPAAG